MATKQQDIYRGNIATHFRLTSSNGRGVIPADCREQAFGTYLDLFIERWNLKAPDWLALNPLPEGSRRQELLKPRLFSGAVTELCEWSLRGEPYEAPGYCLFDDKIEAIVEIMCALAEDDKQSLRIAFDAETQWGKTIVLIMVFLLWNLWCRSTGRRPEVIMLFNLPRNAPDDQTSIDRRAATLLHAVLTFAAASHQTYDLYNANDEHQCLLDRINDSPNQLKRTRNMLPKGDDDDTQLTNAVALAQHHNALLRLLHDEADAGSNFDGVYDRIVKYAETGVDIGLVLISATSYQYRWISDFRQITCKIDDAATSYCGTVRGHLTPIFALGDI